MARWRVTSDTPREELTSAGTFVSIREISFELLDSGATGKVNIPLRSYTPEFVQAEIDAYAKRIEAVGKLTSGM